MIFIGFITLGQALFSLGVAARSWGLMFLGCIVMGLGGESFTVANSALLSEWFKGGELAFAFGVNLSIAKLGSVINDISSPRLAEVVNIVFASWFGVILCGFALISVLLVFPVDLLVEQQIAVYQQRYQLLDSADTTQIEENPLKSSTSRDSSAKGSDEEEHVTTLSAIHAEQSDSSVSPVVSSAPQEELAGIRDVLNLKLVFWMLIVSNFAIYGCVLPFNNISSSFLLERDYFKEPSSQCALQFPTQCPSDSNLPNSYCPSSHFYQPPIPLNYTAAYNPLTDNDIDCTDSFWTDACATSEYCSRLTNAESIASVVMSIPYIISAVLSPVFGFCIDRVGLRAVIATIAPLILIAVHALLGFTTVSPVPLLVGQGLAYTGFASVLWPSIPIVVEEKVTGLAFGVAMSVNNLASAVVPIIAAEIFTESGDKYVPNVELLFISLATLGVIMGLYMNWYDYHHNHLLNGHYFFTPTTHRSISHDQKI